MLLGPKLPTTKLGLLFCNNGSSIGEQLKVQDSQAGAMCSSPNPWCFYSGYHTMSLRIYLYCDITQSCGQHKIIWKIRFWPTLQILALITKNRAKICEPINASLTFFIFSLIRKIENLNSDQQLVTFWLNLWFKSRIFLVRLSPIREGAYYRMGRLQHTPKAAAPISIDTWGNTIWYNFKIPIMQLERT